MWTTGTRSQEPQLQVLVSTTNLTLEETDTAVGVNRKAHDRGRREGRRVEKDGGDTVTGAH